MCARAPVAGFVGHKSARITSEVYIALTAQERREAMNIPWLRDQGNEEAGGGETLRAKALELAIAIASPFGSEDGRTFPRLHTTTSTNDPPPSRPSSSSTALRSKIAELKGRLGLQ